MSDLKIALVKQDVYQDLYVCPVTEKDSSEILFSSMGRVGPIGLMAELGADFYILKEEPDFETQVYRKVIPHLAKYLHLLKTETLDKIPGQEFKQPGSIYPNGKFSVDCHDIDWGYYDVVISINVSIPYNVVKKYPTTLFAYMIGEANMAVGNVRYGYDVTLNQMARGIIGESDGHVIDFPYTYVGKATLSSIMEKSLGRKSKRHGIFMEINSTKERPVTKAPNHFKPLIDAGYDIILHHQRIKENLTAIFDSKYFVKMGGRSIRGNSVAEAISLGALAIMDKDEVIHNELIIEECDVKSMDEMLYLINRLEADDVLYERLKEKQQNVLHELFFDTPLKSIELALENKRKFGARQYSLFSRLVDRILFWIKIK